MLEEQLGFWGSMRGAYIESRESQILGKPHSDVCPLGKDIPYREKVPRFIGCELAVYFFPLVHPMLSIRNTKTNLKEIYNQFRKNLRS